MSNLYLRFRPGIGTNCGCNINAFKYIYKMLDTDNKTKAIFLDFAKAFDTVDHKVLLNILPSFGINNQSLNWFLSDLKDRTQMVMLNDVLENELGIKCGVPQGSVL